MGRLTTFFRPHATPIINRLETTSCHTTPRIGRDISSSDDESSTVESCVIRQNDASSSITSPPPALPAIGHHSPTPHVHDRNEQKVEPAAADAGNRPVHAALLYTAPSSSIQHAINSSSSSSSREQLTCTTPNVKTNTTAVATSTSYYSRAVAVVGSRNKKRNTHHRAEEKALYNNIHSQRHFDTGSVCNASLVIDCERRIKRNRSLESNRAENCSSRASSPGCTQDTGKATTAFVEKSRCKPAVGIKVSSLRVVEIVGEGN